MKKILSILPKLPPPFIFLCFTLFYGHSYSQTNTLEILKTEGDARLLNRRCYLITPDEPWQLGAIWSEQTIDLLEDQRWEFELNFGSKADPLGADGMAFILSPSNELADTSRGRFLGIRQLIPSFAAEFDVFKNASGSGDNDLNDPDQSHFAFQKDGNTKHRHPDCLSKFPTNDGWIQLHESKVNVQDGNWYRFDLDWNASSQIISLYVDGSLRQALSYDLVNDIFSGASNVHWGISGSTGGVSNRQRVCFNWDTLSVEPIDTQHKWRAPNVFSPNGDGMNDVFKVELSKNAPWVIEQLYIYSRWGQLIYEGENSWDGTFNGSEVGQGVYVWVASLIKDNGETETINGSINLLR